MEENEKLKIKESLIDLNKKRGLALLDISKEFSITHFNALIGFIKIAIKDAFLLNGTAGIAILYNIRQLPREINISLCMCAIGAILAVICSGVTYIAYYIYFKCDMKNLAAITNFQFKILIDMMKSKVTHTQPPQRKKDVWGDIFMAFVGLLWLASIFLFFYAAYRAYPLIIDLSAGQPTYDVSFKTL